MNRTYETILSRLDLPVGTVRSQRRPGITPTGRPGAGEQLASSRSYVPGDDPRKIDWNATARNDDLYVRTSEADTSLNIHLCPSLSPSMRFGTIRRKHDVAVEALSALGRIGVRRGEIVTLHLGPHLSLPAFDHHRQRLLTVTAPSWDTLDTTATTILSVNQTRGPGMLLVSVDTFVDDSTLKAIDERRSNLDALIVLVTDPAEVELPNAGSIRLEDPLHGNIIRVNTSNQTVRNAYRKGFAQRRERLLARLNRTGAYVVDVDTNEEVSAALARQLPRRR